MDKIVICREDLIEISKKICDRCTMGDKLCDAIMHLLSAQPEPHWIPCSERLPFAEYGESPNVYCYCYDVERGGRWAEMLYFNGGVWCKPTGETFDYKVLAWYPLPKKPYRGGQDEHTD